MFIIEAASPVRTHGGYLPREVYIDTKLKRRPTGLVGYDMNTYYGSGLAMRLETGDIYRKERPHPCDLTVIHTADKILE